MIGKFLLGALGGFVAARLVQRWRSRRWGGGCGGGGCGGGWARRGGWGRFGGHGRFGGFGFGGPRQLFWMLHELDLDAGQRTVVREVVERVGRAMAGLGIGMRMARMHAVGDVADALGAEQFDRAHIDGILERQTQSIAEVRKEFVDGLARVHETLRPEQRARLRDLLRGGPGPGYGGGGGDYGPGHSEGPYR